MNTSKPSCSYSTAYVAKRLGVSIPTIQRWVDAGRLRAWKTLGGHRRIDAESADILFNQQDGGMFMAEYFEPIVVNIDENLFDRERLAEHVERPTPVAHFAVA